MITKELVDFVKKMRLEKHADTEIMSMLVSNGWLSMDVMEAFQAIDAVTKNVQTPPIPPIPSVAPMIEPVVSINTPSQIPPVMSSIPVEPVPFQMPPNISAQINNLQPINVGIPKDISMMPKEKEKSTSHKGLIAFFVVLFFVLALGVSAYFYRDNLKNLLGFTEVPQVIVPEVPQPVVPIAPTVLNCVDSMDCFVGAAQNNCQLAKLDYSTSIPLPFNPKDHPNLITAKSTRHFEIRGKENDNCIFYEKLISSSVVLDQTELAKITNVTVKDKASSEVLIGTMNKSAGQMVGKDAICKVTPLVFKTKMDNEIKGNFSVSGSIDTKTGKTTSNDPYVSQCVGELYNPTVKVIQ